MYFDKKIENLGNSEKNLGHQIQLIYHQILIISLVNYKVLLRSLIYVFILLLLEILENFIFPSLSEADSDLKIGSLCPNMVYLLF